MAIKEKGFIHIKNFFTESELPIIQDYCRNRVFHGFSCDIQSPLAPSFYKDPLMDSFLNYKLPLAEKISGLKLFKTYSFWRAYIFGSILLPHKDRPSCEISITANIDNEGQKWPIYMGNEEIIMDKGDGLMYLGCEITHGRKTFEGDYNAQVFMHYVDQNGPYKDFKDD
jgi:hypothetical protein